MLSSYILFNHIAAQSGDLMAVVIYNVLVAGDWDNFNLHIKTNVGTLWAVQLIDAQTAFGFTRSLNP